MAKSKDNKKKGNTGSPRITNRKAHHDYHISDKLECGIVLVGSEVKAIRAGRVSLDHGFARIENGGRALWLYNLDIGAYDHAAADAQHEAKRKRKLLAHKRQIMELFGKTTAKGVTLVPLAMYFNDRGMLKVEIGIGEGKRQSDKRETLKKKEADKAIRRGMTRRVI